MKGNKWIFVRRKRNDLYCVAVLVFNIFNMDLESLIIVQSKHMRAWTYIRKQKIKEKRNNFFLKKISLHWTTLKIIVSVLLCLFVYFVVILFMMDGKMQKLHFCLLFLFPLNLLVFRINDGSIIHFRKNIFIYGVLSQQHRILRRRIKNLNHFNGGH